MIATFDYTDTSNSTIVLRKSVYFQPFIQKIRRCGHCQRYGHTVKICRSNKAPPTCEYCGNSGHEYKDCNSTASQCINCVRSKKESSHHKASDPKCPIFIEQKEIKKVMATLCPKEAEIYIKTHGVNSTDRRGWNIPEGPPLPTLADFMPYKDTRSSKSRGKHSNRKAHNSLSQSREQVTSPGSFFTSSSPLCQNQSLPDTIASNFLTSFTDQSNPQPLSSVLSYHTKPAPENSLNSNKNKQVKATNKKNDTAAIHDTIDNSTTNIPPDIQFSDSENIKSKKMENVPLYIEFSSYLMELMNSNQIQINNDTLFNNSYNISMNEQNSNADIESRIMNNPLSLDRLIKKLINITNKTLKQ